MQDRLLSIHKYLLNALRTYSGWKVFTDKIKLHSAWVLQNFVQQSDISQQCFVFL
jgi:hypothetical protein